MKYRKKPVVIEAVLFKDSDESVSSLIEFTNGKFVAFGNIDNYLYAKIETLEGVMTAEIEDYIIRGVNGEFYRCKPDIFTKTYELVED